jgi:hypothetical protein
MHICVCVPLCINRRDVLQDTKQSFYEGGDAVVDMEEGKFFHGEVSALANEYAVVGFGRVIAGLTQSSFTGTKIAKRLLTAPRMTSGSCKLSIPSIKHSVKVQAPIMVKVYHTGPVMGTSAMVRMITQKSIPQSSPPNVPVVVLCVIDVFARSVKRWFFKYRPSVLREPKK